MSVRSLPNCPQPESARVLERGDPEPPSEPIHSALRIPMYSCRHEGTPSYTGCKTSGDRALADVGVWFALLQKAGHAGFDFGNASSR